VVEAVSGMNFIPNDCSLGGEDRLLMVITGPNMAGKSTYLRQVALITLLAHCGSFVPAAEAEIPVVDRLFTRIGASDDLAAGRSTFMVEMTETANILRNMSSRSLVVLDEIGRGTSTFDGISIAWAVAEAMVGGGVKTLFATHYHELAQLASEHDEVENFSVAVRRYKGDIVFLYRVLEGAASGSYGIEVARLAGLPTEVIATARVLLDRFESAQGAERALESHPQTVAQLGLFDASFSAKAACTEVLKELAVTDTENLTPLEALQVLEKLVRAAKKVQ
jgi:DNA mismatch repair protein MutS